MKVWRVQNSQGRGPYSYLGMDAWAVSDHCDDNHPNPYLDFGLCSDWVTMTLDEQKNWFFGFESMDSLKKWFCEKELENLQALGFIPVELEAEKIIVGSFQVIFTKKLEPPKMGIDYDEITF